MGVDWTALEEAIFKSALRQAREVMDHHPDQEFYGLALDGVSTEPAERIELPVLALNSEQALAKDLRDSQLSVPPPDDDGDVGEPMEDRGPIEEIEDYANDPAEHDGADPEDLDDEEAPSAEADEDEPDLDLDIEPTEDGFYSTRWDASEWHWCSMDLFDESAAELWSEALTRVARADGWEPTIRRYYGMLIDVVTRLRAELAADGRGQLVAFVSDEDHAEVLLQRCLSPEQLRRHFPELAGPELAGQEALGR